MFGGLVKPRCLKTTDRLRPLPINPPGVRTDMGHVTMKPGSDYKTRLFLYEQRKRGNEQQEIIKNKKLNSLEIHRQEFVNRTDKKMGISTIKSTVNFTLTAREQDLNKKRERLAALIKSEDEYYEEEFINNVKTSFENDLKNREQKLLEIKKDRERQNQDFIVQKKIQQYINKCDEIRPYLRQKLLEDSKACQLVQIEDNKKKIVENQDQDNIWLKVAQRSAEQQLQREHDQKRLRITQNYCSANELKRQMQANAENREREKREAIEERIQNEIILKGQMDKELELKRIKENKQRQIAADLKEQLRQVHRCREIRETDEANFLQMFSDSTQMEIRKEKALQQSGTAAAKRETRLYLDHVKHVKEERAVEDAEREKIVEDIRKKADKEYIRIREANKAKRAALSASVYSGVQQQIQRKAKIREIEYNKQFSDALKDREIYDYNAKLEKDAEIRKHYSALKYGQELKEQIVFCQKQQQREKELQDIELQKVREEENYCENICKQFIASHIDVLPLHPNVKLLGLGGKLNENNSKINWK